MIEIFKKLSMRRFHPPKSIKIAILESWIHFDKENFFKLVKFMPGRIKAALKAQGGGVIKY